MGKGTIISGGIGGEYSVQIEHLTTELNANIAKNTASLATVNAQIAIETDADKLTTLKLKKASLLADQKYLQGLAAKINTTGWCVDVTENMTGTVGTIEVPGERRTFVNLQNDNTHTPARDGQLEKAGAGKTAAVIWNLAMLPGWQKWKPTYRYATITSLNISSSDYGNDYCDVTLESAISTQQSLDVNQTTTLSNVPIKYMDCNGAGFKVGDVVIVRFKGQDWNDPVVIGYKEEPKYCHHIALIVVYLQRLVADGGFGYWEKSSVIAWDAKNDKLLKGPVDVDDEDLQKWYGYRDVITSSNLAHTLCGTYYGTSGLLPANRVDWDKQNGRFGYSTQASGCPLLVPDGVDHWLWGAPYNVYPEEYSYHILAATWDPSDSYDYSRFPISGYINAIIGDNEAPTLAGIRTEGDYCLTVNMDGDKWPSDGTHYDANGNLLYHYAGDWKNWTKTSTLSHVLTFHTPLGGGSKSLGFTWVSVWPGDGYPYTNTWSGRYAQPEWSAFDFKLFLAYTKNVFVNVCVRQHMLTHYAAYTGDGEQQPLTNTMPREIYVEGNALYDRNSVYGVDWITAGRNSAFEAAVKGAIEQAYTLNGITDNYVREAYLTVQFLR